MNRAPETNTFLSMGNINNKNMPLKNNIYKENSQKIVSANQLCQFKKLYGSMLIFFLITFWNLLSGNTHEN